MFFKTVSPIELFGDDKDEKSQLKLLEVAMVDFSEKELLEGVDRKIRMAYLDVKNIVHGMHSDIEERIEEKMVGYYTDGNGLAWVQPAKDSITIRLRKGDYKDRHGKSIPLGRGDYPELNMSADEIDIELLKSLIAQTKFYNISSLLEFLALSSYDEDVEKTIYTDTYLALCKAFGVPPDWKKQHANMNTGVTRRSSQMYLSLRKAFHQPFYKHHFLPLFADNNPAGLKIQEMLTGLLKRNREKLLEIDKAFFREIFDVDTEKTFTEYELVNNFGMPSTEARREWYESLGHFDADI